MAACIASLVDSPAGGGYHAAAGPTAETASQSVVLGWPSGGACGSRSAMRELRDEIAVGGCLYPFSLSRAIAFRAISFPHFCPAAMHSLTIRGSALITRAPVGDS